MQVIEKGNYKNPDWSMEVRCTGEGWNQKKGNRPCYSKLKLESDDIVKRGHHGYGEEPDVSYGFICSECHCFTEIPEKEIPKEIRNYCLQVAAKGSDAYPHLTDEEKALSEVL